MKSAALSLYFALLVRVVVGQSSTPSSSAAPSLVETGSGSTVATHVVTVGKELNQFQPDSLTANKGDIISFQFFPPNHSVGRAEYQQPCIPYEDTGTNKVGFWSGFFPLNIIPDNPPTWDVTVNDTEPIFFYCAAPGSCINYQMVGVINPNSSVSLATQKEDASNSQYMLAPGQPFPSEGTVPSGDVSPGNSSTSSPAAASSHATASSHSSKLSGGAIAGIVIAGVVGTILVGAVFFLLGRNKTMLQFMRRDQYQAGSQNPPGPDMRSPTPHMNTYPAHANAVPYPETPNYHDAAYDTPPYTEHPTLIPTPQPIMAELPSPGDKNAQEYMGVQDHHDNRAPTPQPQKRPLSFFGRARSTKTQTSELSADAPTKGPSVKTNRYQPNR